MSVLQLYYILNSSLTFLFQESLADWERGITDAQIPSPGGGRKWSARTAAHAQDTATDQAAPVNNNTDACKLLIVSY